MAQGIPSDEDALLLLKAEELLPILQDTAPMSPSLQPLP